MPASKPIIATTRVADVPDIKQIIVLAYELLEKSVYKGTKPDEKKFRSMLAMFMGGREGCVLVVVDECDVPQGFFLGAVQDHFFSRCEVATDVCSYVRDGYSASYVFMVKRFIRWAKKRPKVAHITLGISSGIGDVRRVGCIYHKLGLPSVGGLYTMEIRK